MHRMSVRDPLAVAGSASHEAAGANLGREEGCFSSTSLYSHWQQRRQHRFYFFFRDVGRWEAVVTSSPAPLATTLRESCGGDGGVTFTTPSLPTSRCTADGLFVVPRPASALTPTPPPLPVGFEAARVFYRLGLLRVNNRPAELML